MTATMGLICFRDGDIETGRKMYDNAVTGFKALNNYSSAAVATYYWAVEEKRINSINAELLFEEAKKKIEKYKVFAFEDLVNKL